MSSQTFLPRISGCVNLLDYGLTEGSAPGQLFLVPIEIPAHHKALQELGAFMANLSQVQTSFDPDVSEILQTKWNTLFD